MYLSKPKNIYRQARWDSLNWIDHTKNIIKSTTHVKSSLWRRRYMGVNIMYYIIHCRWNFRLINIHDTIIISCEMYPYLPIHLCVYNTRIILYFYPCHRWHWYKICVPVYPYGRVKKSSEGNVCTRRVL